MAVIPAGRKYSPLRLPSVDVQSMFYVWRCVQCPQRSLLGTGSPYAIRGHVLRPLMLQYLEWCDGGVAILMVHCLLHDRLSARWYGNCLNTSLELHRTCGFSMSELWHTTEKILAVDRCNTSHSNCALPVVWPFDTLQHSVVTYILEAEPLRTIFALMFATVLNQGINMGSLCANFLWLCVCYVHVCQSADSYKVRKEMWHIFMWCHITYQTVHQSVGSVQPKGIFSV